MENKDWETIADSFNATETAGAVAETFNDLILEGGLDLGVTITDGPEDLKETLTELVSNGRSVFVFDPEEIVKVMVEEAKKVKKAQATQDVLMNKMVDDEHLESAIRWYNTFDGMDKNLKKGKENNPGKDPKQIWAASCKFAPSYMKANDDDAKKITDLGLELIKRMKEGDECHNMGVKMELAVETVFDFYYKSEGETETLSESSIRILVLLALEKM